MAVVAAVNSAVVMSAAPEVVNVREEESKAVLTAEEVEARVEV